MSSPQQPVHKRRTTGEEDDDDIDPMVDQQGCGKVYAKLEECLAEHDRDWRQCQKEVMALRECYASATASAAKKPAKGSSKGG
ncbi:hypothetical protein KFL_006590040 [Klebsormidium nitens]|uniref:CHCH domain-containing protein n=1 Tax=Klebsormidium nitens TaxID=105231 RepID=A0A1Y1IN53_KLENI|nr:hypothetical protein KFL_006590040 [Klebsormidium nitens]|eukprot:GAQ90591.1 hypothetical protein KFL_006590040 [Klebsormidium nitens]